MDRKFTPEHITELKENEIFVFGSNLAGMHRGGAARVARERFGAVMGQGEGLQGQSYAIPTMQGGVETIRPYVDRFIDFAAQNPQLTFYVTRIGCGIAGFSDEEIAPLFAAVLKRPGIFEEHVILPKSFVDILTSEKICHSYLEDWQNGYTSFDMAVDAMLTLNRLKHYGLQDKEQAISDWKEMLLCRYRGPVFAHFFWDAFNNGFHGSLTEKVKDYFGRVAENVCSEGPLMAPVYRYMLNVAKETAAMMMEMSDWTPDEKPTGAPEEYTFLDIIFCIMTGRGSEGDNDYVYDTLIQGITLLEWTISERWETLFVGNRLRGSRFVALLSDPELWQEWEKRANHNKTLAGIVGKLFAFGVNANNDYNLSTTGYYYPMTDMSRPVFSQSRGRVDFPNLKLKQSFISTLTPNLN